MAIVNDNIIICTTQVEWNQAPGQFDELYGSMLKQKRQAVFLSQHS